MAKRTAHYQGDRELEGPLAYLTSIPQIKKVFPAAGQTHKHHKMIGTFSLTRMTSNGIVLKLYHSKGSVPVYVSCTDPTSLLQELRDKGKLQ